MSFIKNLLGLGGTTTEPQKKNTVRALPASWYISQQMYDLERRAIFSKKWLLTTHSLRLVETGDWLRAQVSGFEFFLIKNEQGKINGFHNVCRHRAYPVVTEEQGHSNGVLSAKEHGWSYDLNGNLTNAPGFQDVGDFDVSQNGLLSIHVHVDDKGFVWVNLDGKDTPEIAWDEDFEGVDTQARFQKYNFENYQFDHAWEMEGDYNWKILADNYNECYHCKSAHPDIPKIADLNSYFVRTKAEHIQHYGNPTPEQIANGFLVASTYYFPNASMNIS